MLNTRRTSKNTSGNKKVFVGLSGGVDSAVSAALLKRDGYDVIGVFIKTWTPDNVPCTWRAERRDAMRVAAHLDIPFIFLDLSDEYKKGVADYMIEEYKRGRTPNPDVMCNREVKFGAFWAKAQEMGADFIATGHYAQNLPRVTFGTEGYPRYMSEGKDAAKDQSYFLWMLGQDDLSHTLFPVGHLEKSEVRALAKTFELPVSEKKDSQGICFIGEVTLEEFLSEFVETTQGDVLNTQGEVIGTHKGAIYYTPGERHGFEITRKTPTDAPYYVISKDMRVNTITVSNDKQEIEDLSPTKIRLTLVNWINRPEKPGVSARIRYRGEKLPVSLGETSEGYAVEFNKPQRGLSLGQSIVFYDGNECLGGAIMDAII